jgi:hypothetical protein
MVLFGVEEFLPSIPGPLPRDFGAFMGTDRAEHFFHGAWGWFAVIVVLALSNTVLGEELLFRGCSCRECGEPSDRGTGSPTGCCSRPTTCTSHG